MHHEWIRNYLMQCNVEFEYPEVPAVNVDIDDNLIPFKNTVDREIETTGGINNIVNQAKVENDYATLKFLNGDGDEFGMLVKEQIEEQKISMDIYNIAKIDTDWLTK
jgi:ferritin